MYLIRTKPRKGRKEILPIGKGGQRNSSRGGKISSERVGSLSHAPAGETPRSSGERKGKGHPKNRREKRFIARNRRAFAMKRRWHQRERGKTHLTRAYYHEKKKRLPQESEERSKTSPSERGQRLFDRGVVFLGAQEFSRHGEREGGKGGPSATEEGGKESITILFEERPRGLGGRLPPSKRKGRSL